MPIEFGRHAVNQHLFERPLDAGAAPLKMKSMGNGYYIISDRDAGRLARASRHGQLPKFGREIDVALPNGRTAILSREFTSRTDAPKRGWVWAVRRSAKP